ncbi:MAG: lipid A biosynthesis acyltransferase [Bacteroidota bacterium]|nr:lipid A biosynthesis acyltransferase [Bacteroidota bacterium]
MEQWDGKSKGTLLGYKIFVFLLKKIGVGAAYTLLYFVAAYYYVFHIKSSRAMYTYFRERLKYSKIKALLSVYKNYYVFGQTIIDKVAISSGLRDRYTYEFDGIDILKNLLEEKKGGVLISAHIGNFEIAEKFFADIDFEMQINLVTTDLERNVIKEYLESICQKTSLKYIFIKEDLSHIFEINNALSNNELICFTGDRYFAENKTIEADFLGKKAKFPLGPFLIASKLRVPVVFVYVMKENNKHYHLYARRAVSANKNPQVLLDSYISNLEGMIEKYPLQWFNYFDFWK